MVCGFGFTVLAFGAQARGLRVEGLGVWVKGSGSMLYTSKTLHIKHDHNGAPNKVSECGRSGIVAFGKARVQISGSAVIGCKVHGVCARGRATVEAVNSIFAGNNFR